MQAMFRFVQIFACSYRKFRDLNYLEFAACTAVESLYAIVVLLLSAIYLWPTRRSQVWNLKERYKSTRFKKKVWS
jgi:hypothetical protein